MKTEPTVLRRLAGSYRPYRASFAFAAFLMAIAALSQGVLVFLIEHVLDDVLIAKDQAALASIPWLLLGLYAIKGVASAGQAFLVNRAGFGVVMTLRHKVFSHLLGQEMSWHKRTPSAEQVSRISNDLGQVDGLAHAFAGLVEKPLTIFVLLGTAMWLDWRLTLAAVAVLPLIALAILGFAGHQRSTTQACLDSVAALAQTTQESLDGIAEIQAFAGESQRIAAFQAQNERQRALRLREAIARFIPGPVVEALAALGIGLVIAYGGHRVVEGALLPGELMAFLVALGLLNVPFKGLAQVSVHLQRAAAGADAAFAILDRAPQIQGGGKTLSADQCHLSFEDVGVDFGEGPVLKAVNFQVAPGERLAIVGPSGVGKTSLLALLPRFIDPAQGRICINGEPLAGFSLESLREHMAWVGQENVLFDGSVAENLRLSKANASEEELIQACRSAQAHGFIQALPNGYETRVGPRGARLSGGQAQRICIARALLADAPILLLDEATSALDRENERALYSALDKLMSERTVLAVSHRLESIVDADKILLLGEGGILAVGTHQSLLTESVHYRQLLGAR
jgi:subfamily B ATP-binding cassette protein MsbA